MVGREESSWEAVGPRWKIGTVISVRVQVCGVESWIQVQTRNDTCGTGGSVAEHRACLYIRIVMSLTQKTGGGERWHRGRRL